jgi:hypothetical protein
MDLAVAWYQEEQEGEAKRLWSNIWDTAEMVRFNFIIICLEFLRINSSCILLASASIAKNNIALALPCDLQIYKFSFLQEFQQQLLQQQQQQLANSSNGNNSDTKSNDSNTSNNNFPIEKTFNPTRRKGSTNDNKASTYNMNKYQAKLVGKHGGCPWRPVNFHYGRGIIG